MLDSIPVGSVGTKTRIVANGSLITEFGDLQDLIPILYGTEG